MKHFPTRLLLTTDRSEDAMLARAIIKPYAEARRLLEAQAKHLEHGGRGVAETHTKRGPADDEIVNLAEEIGPRLIAIVSRGLG
jgi:nucleotide-binding universal stress UspA family protein